MVPRDGHGSGRPAGRVGSGRVAGQSQGRFGGSGRVGSKFLKCIIFFSLSVGLSKFFRAIAPNIEFCKKVSKYVAKQNVDFYGASTS